MPQDLFVKNTPLAIVLALAGVGLLGWRVNPSTFRALGWPSVGIASAVFWGVLAALLVATSWEFYYSFFMPGWERFVTPLAAIVFYFVLGIILRWAALRLPGNPVVWFPLLGGLGSIPEHAIAIYRFGILDIPVLRGSTPLAIFIFAYFEYVIFWSVALALALGLERLRRVIRLRRTDQA